jgi:hypothetical protein
VAIFRRRESAQLSSNNSVTEFFWRNATGSAILARQQKTPKWRFPVVGKNWQGAFACHFDSKRSCESWGGWGAATEVWGDFKVRPENSPMKGTNLLRRIEGPRPSALGQNCARSRTVPETMS